MKNMETDTHQGCLYTDVWEGELQPWSCSGNGAMNSPMYKLFKWHSDKFHSQLRIDRE